MLETEESSNQPAHNTNAQNYTTQQSSRNKEGKKIVYCVVGADSTFSVFIFSYLHMNTFLIAISFTLCSN